MQDISLFFSPQPTRSARARWAFLEAGLQFEPRTVDIFAGQQNEPAFLEVNPLGFVPAAVIDGEPMIESSALALWAAMQAPDQGLLPDRHTAAFRACLQWVVHAPAELDRLFAVLNTHTRFRPPELRNTELVGETMDRWHSRAEQLSRVLSSQPWMVGDHFTVADVAIGHAVVWARMLDILGNHRALIDYLERLQGRKAFQSVYGPRVETFPDPHG